MMSASCSGTSHLAGSLVGSASGCLVASEETRGTQWHPTRASPRSQLPLRPRVYGATYATRHTCRLASLDCGSAASTSWRESRPRFPVHVYRSCPVDMAYSIMGGNRHLLRMRGSSYMHTFGALGSDESGGFN